MGHRLHLTQKGAVFALQRFLVGHPPPIPNPPYRFNAMDEVVDRAPSSSPSSSAVPSSASSSDPRPPTSFSQPAVTSYAQLEARSYAVRERVVAEKQEKKGTGPAYERHYTAYQLWWHQDQAKLQTEDPAYVTIPALPITVPKVVVFLEYEKERPQKRKLTDGTSSTSTCGLQHAKQVISALEYYRLNNQHQYRDNAEAQIVLRTDPRIKAMEKAFAASEPERVKKANVLKAAGTRADAFVDTELVQMSLSQLLEPKGGMNMWRGQRDRAMLVASCSTALRGDSTRSILWSDMGSYDVPMLAKGPGQKVKALLLRADQSKVNTNGRVDEHGAFRHINVALCPIGAIAFFFFSHFHIIEAPVPNFAPNYDNPNYGDYGHRQWYELFLFSSTKDCTKEMVYQTHRNAVKTIYQKHNVNISKVTHAGRGYTAKSARENGASSTEVKALGCWSDTGSFRPCYDRALPVEALLASAGFDGKRPESHFLARGELEPPEDVLKALFPFVEPELEKFAKRKLENRQSEDFALKQFLELLDWLRTVLIQDAAVLYDEHRDAPMFQFSPFDSPSFRTFAHKATATIKKAEENAALQLKNLPQNYANTFSGIVTHLTMQQQLQHDKILSLVRDLSTSGSSASSRKRRKTHHSESLTLSPVSYEAEPASSSTYMQATTTTLHPSTRSNLPLPDTPSTSSIFTQAPLPLALDSFDFNFNFNFDAISQSAGPQWSPEQQTVLGYLNSTNAPTPSHAVSPVLIPPPPPPLLPSLLLPPPLNNPPPLLRNRPSNDAAVPMSQGQVTEWCQLATRYGEGRIRRHQWEGYPTGEKGKEKLLLPYYSYRTPSKILDIWEEYSAGFNGSLSVRELEEGWGSDWRRGNRGTSSEHCRRAKVWKLIEQLVAKRNWNTELALRFVREQYQEARTANGALRFSTPRSFCDWLQKKSDGKTGLEVAMAESNTFVA
ncbi:hypothetical protein MVEN_02466400 [Mycena venus]|uniref:Transcription activator GCR1-like domain-containing protein n=1 Tax=Mycena venus TaxID=2733690 RepID=A0A8H6WX67_9AGAR|nr:hypothetical protein MVEN_02466400 [Mycena venus]